MNNEPFFSFQYEVGFKEYSIIIVVSASVAVFSFSVHDKQKWHITRILSRATCCRVCVNKIDWLELGMCSTLSLS